MKCWAKVLGDCSGRQSREHVFSASLFEGPTVIVDGYPWLSSGPREIGVSSLTAKILCQGHNSVLSALDAAASDAFKKFEQIADLQVVRSKASASWPVIRYEISGNLLERWFLKTATNVFFVTGRKEARRDANPAMVRAVFGLDEIPPPMGLYLSTKLGVIVDLSPHVNLTPVWDAEKRPSSALFSFCGFRFVLWLSDQQPSDWMFDEIPGWENPDLSPRVVEMNLNVNFNVSGRLSQVLQISRKAAEPHPA